MPSQNYALTAADVAFIAAQAATAPPFSVAIKSRLAVLLGGR